MDTELLVDERVDEGRALLTQLVAQGFEVSVALWIKPHEDGSWLLYIASPQVERGPIAEAYRATYAALGRLKDASITISDIKLIAPSNPIARDAMAFRERVSSRSPTRYTGQRLGQLVIREAYIYPTLAAGMSRTQVLETITQLMNRTGRMEHSLVTLRSGASLNAVPVGVQVQPPGGIVVVLHNTASGVNESFPVDEIANIQ